MSEETTTKETTSDEAETPAEDQAQDVIQDETAEVSAEAAAEETVAQEPAAEEAAAEEPAPAAEEAPPEEPAAEAADAAAAEEEAAPAAEAPAETEAAAAPDYTYHDLHEMNVAQLREVAAKIEHDAVHGYSTMHKEHLLPAICTALGIERHEHHEVVGLDKEPVKLKIRALKKERDEAEAAGDSAKLKVLRRRIRSLKRKIRKATV